MLIYPSRLPVATAGVFRGETGCVLSPLLLIGCTQERVRGKLMTPAIDASSLKGLRKGRAGAGRLGMEVRYFKTQRAALGSDANH